jgi:two-component system, response regulator
MNDSIHDVDILMVEDSPDDAMLIIRELKKNNLSNRLVHLTDGVQALDFLFCKGTFSDRNIEHKPKLVLLDLKMPKIDGLQVLREIRQDPRTRSIPVVMMTSSREERDIAETYNLGVNAYVVKPVEFDNFSKAVTEIGMFWLLTNQSPK